MYSAFDSAASCRAGGSAAGGGRRKEKIRKTCDRCSEGKWLSVGRSLSAAGSIITEIHTGQILWEENKDVSWAPASMTKLMTILLAYDAMEEGKFEKDMQVAVNEKYTDIAGRYALSNNVMQMGATYTVGELIDLIIVPSSAAATYMLADLVEPDPDKFVALMNQKAKEIGMTHTTYYNCVGVTNDLLYPYAPKIYRQMQIM